MRGYWSPTLGVRGWVGIVLLCALVAIITVLGRDWPWWGTALWWVAVAVGPIELLRTDAIQRVVEIGSFTVPRTKRMGVDRG